MTPKVSIITPCYNSSEFIEETIKSVLDQTFQDWEWLITDDKSSDNTAEGISPFWIVMIIGSLCFWNE